MKDISLYGLLIIVIFGLILVGVLLANIPAPPQLVNTNQPDISVTPDSIFSLLLGSTGDWISGVVDWLNPFN